MIYTFLYYVILLLIIFLLMFISYNNKYSPNKIKTMVSLAVFLCYVRFVTLFAYIFIDKQSYAQYLRFFNFLYLIYVPIILLICFYIFWRNSRIDFNLAYIFLVVLSVVNVICVFLFKPYLKVTTQYGYIAYLEYGDIYNFIYTVLVVLFLALVIWNMDEKFSNKIGMILLLLVTVGVITENILSLLNITYIPNNVISEFLLLLLWNFSILTFKNKATKS